MLTVEQNQPGASTWFLLLFYFLTDLWLLLIAILSVRELVGSAYISPLGWAISLPLVSFLFVVVWLWIYFVDGVNMKSKRSSEKDMTFMNLSDYSSWTLTGFLAFLLHFVMISITTISYVARYGNDSQTTRTDFAMFPSAQTWILSCVLFVAVISLLCLFFHSVATWKYWTLTWSCANRSLFKNPFYPEKNVIFQKRKQ